MASGEKLNPPSLDKKSRSPTTCRLDGNTINAKATISTVYYKQHISTKQKKNWTHSWGQFNKEIQVYFSSRTLVFTNSHQFESTKSLYKFPLEASNLYLQWYSIGFNQLQVENLHVHSALVVSLLNWPLACHVSSFSDLLYLTIPCDHCIGHALITKKELESDLYMEIMIILWSFQILLLEYSLSVIYLNDKSYNQNKV